MLSTHRTAVASPGQDTCSCFKSTCGGTLQACRMGHVLCDGHTSSITSSSLLPAREWSSSHPAVGENSVATNAADQHAVAAAVARPQLLSVEFYMRMPACNLPGANTSPADTNLPNKRLSCVCTREAPGPNEGAMINTAS